MNLGEKFLHASSSQKGIILKHTRALLASLVAQLVKNLPVMQETTDIPGSRRSPGEGIGSPLQILGFLWWLRWYVICLHCGRPRFKPWVGKIPWRREPTPVFLPGELHPWGHKESKSTEQLSLQEKSASFFLTRKKAYLQGKTS